MTIVACPAASSGGPTDPAAASNLDEQRLAGERDDAPSEGGSSDERS